MDFIIWAWKTAPGIALNIHKTSQRQNAGAASDRMAPGLRGASHTGQRCFLAGNFESLDKERRQR